MQQSNRRSSELHDLKQITHALRTNQLSELKTETINEAIRKLDNRFATREWFADLDSIKRTHKLTGLPIELYLSQTIHPICLGSKEELHSLLAEFGPISRAINTFFSLHPKLVQQLARFHQLTDLHLSLNHISRSTADLAPLKNLKRVSIHRTSGTRRIGLTPLVNLTQLEELRIHANHRFAIDGLQCFPWLQVLTIKDSVICSDADFDCLPALKRLNSLSIDESALLTNRFITSLAGCKSLKSLSIRFNNRHYHDEYRMLIGELSGLEELDLFGNTHLQVQVLIPILQRLLNLKRLRTPTLHTPSHNLFQRFWTQNPKTQLCETLAQSPKLRHLDLQETSLAPFELAALAKSQSITELSILTEDLTDNHLKELAGLQTLNTLHLASPTRLTAQGFEYLKMLPNLTSLTIQHAEHVQHKPALVVSLARLPKLQTLYLRGEIQARRLSRLGTSASLNQLKLNDRNRNDLLRY